MHISPTKVGVIDTEECRVETGRPQVEMADIFRLYGDTYRATVPLSKKQRVAMRDITECRTAALGGHVDVCDSCGVLQVAYNSCRNRHCPKCGALAKAEWVEAQRVNLLPTHYFHVVFTIDHDFNAIGRVNQRAIYNLLFR
ncbi:MAG: transposase zinc-binding domain-containing protein, partial [Chloroflexota bacterium]